MIPSKAVKRTSDSTATKSKRIFLEIYESIRYSSWQRNQLAAVIALVSGIIFLILGYKANVSYYYTGKEWR